MDNKLLELAKFAMSFGIGLRFANTGVDYGYKPAGKKFKRSSIQGHIYIGVSPKTVMYQPLINIRRIIAKAVCHELGHFLIAPPGRRYRTDYGITPDLRKNRLSQKTGDKWDLDEFKAVLVQNQLIDAFGLEDRIRVLKDPLWRRKRQGYSRLLLCRKADKWYNDGGKAMIAKMIDDWRNT